MANFFKSFFTGKTEKPESDKQKNNKKNYFFNIKTAESTNLDLGKKALI